MEAEEVKVAAEVEEVEERGGGRSGGKGEGRGKGEGEQIAGWQASGRWGRWRQRR